MTVHWIAYERPAEKQDIVMKSSLLAFQQITGKHTGKRLAEVVFKLLQRAEINGGEVCTDFVFESKFEIN